MVDLRWKSEERKKRERGRGRTRGNIIMSDESSDLVTITLPRETIMDVFFFFFFFFFFEI